MKRTALGVLIAVTTVGLLFTAGSAALTDVADPPGPGATSAHNWTLENVTDYGNSTQELDTITVDYPSGFSFDGLTEKNATVTMTRTLFDGKDTSEISLNERTYSGSTAVLELSGYSQTDVAGPIEITIDGIENPPDEGEYNVSFTLDGDNGTKTVERSLNITGQPNIGVDIQSTNSPVGAGENLTVTAAIDNTGTAQGTQTVTLDAGELGTTSQNVTLAPGAVETRTFSIPTSSSDIGQYSVTLSSNDSSDTQQVEVLEPDPNFQISIDSSNAPITPGETLTVDMSINNTGARSDTQTIQLENGGAVRASTSVTLSSGASTTETLMWDTSGDTVGAVSTVSTENDSETLITTQDNWGLVNSKNTGSSGPVALSPDGALVAHGSGSDVFIYDPQTERQQLTVTVASGLGALDWHPDGDRIAIGGSGNVHIYNVTADTLIDTITQPGSGLVHGVEWSPSGDRLLYLGEGGTARIADADTLAVQRTESVDGQTHHNVAWSTDGERFAVGGCNEFSVYQVGGGQLSHIDATIPERSCGLNGLAFANDGESIVAASAVPSGGALYDRSGNLEVFDVTSGERTDQIDDGELHWDVESGPLGDRVVVVQPEVPRTEVFAVESGELTSLRTFAANGDVADERLDVDWSHGGDHIADTPLDASGWRVFTSLPLADGTVSDSDGNPIDGVYTELSQNGQRIDAMLTGGNGAFTLTAPESGTYNLTAAKTTGNQQIFETKTISVPDDGTTVPFTTTLIDTGISGKVVDAQGNPIPGATVTTNRTVQSTPVNTQGAFALDTGTGGFVVSADAPGYRSDAAAVSVTAGNVTSGVTLQLEETTGVPISGSVVDPQGNPIDGADVFVGPNATQTNLQGNYVAEVPGTGTFVVTAATSVDSKTRTVTVTDPNGTSGVDFVLARPSDPANATGNLEIRFENTGALVNNRTVTVGFFNDQQERFTERTTTTGLVNLETLNESAPIVAVGEAPGLFARRIIINDLSGRSILFLLDDNKANSTVVVQDFALQDDTGRFSGGDTRFVIKRAMPLPGETDDIPLRVLGADLLGANERFGIALETDVRYRITVKNDDGDVRDLGPHFAVSEGLVRIDIGQIEFNRRDEGTFSADADVEDLSSGDGASELVTFNYKDAENLTSKVRVKIYNQTNESQVIHNQVHLAPNGTAFGNLTVSELVTGSLVGSRWVVEYEITRRNETQSGVITVTSQPSQLRIPLSGQWQTILGIGMVVIIGGLFSTRNAAVGAIIVPSVAGTLWLIGILSGPISGAAVALALTLGVAYNFATRGV